MYLYGSQSSLCLVKLLLAILGWESPHRDAIHCALSPGVPTQMGRAGEYLSSNLYHDSQWEYDLKCMEPEASLENSSTCSICKIVSRKVSS